MHEKYVPQQIEKKWQKIWEDTKAFETHSDPSRKKYYVLEMFPYPSGNLHMGHVRNYSIGDVVARFKTMQGFNVIHPMGFDAFGMPAENAAIKHGIPPAEWTYSNIDNMTRQQKELGLSYDWDRNVSPAVKITTSTHRSSSRSSTREVSLIRRKQRSTGAKVAIPSLQMNRSKKDVAGAARMKSSRKTSLSGS